jgi:uncharacterized protein
MAIKLRKPILVGGIGISIALWIWNSLGESVIHLSELGTMGAIALGMGLWWWQQKNHSNEILLPVNRETVEKEIASATEAIAKVETEAPETDIFNLKAQIAKLPELLNRQELKIAVTGSKRVGKTSLKQILETQNIGKNVSFQETEPLSTQTEAKEQAAIKVSQASDLLLFISAGDLTDSEWQTLQELRASNLRLILIFNQQDRYLPEERAFIWQQLRQRVEQIIPKEDVVAISASPAKVKVRQHQEDGSVQEKMEQPLPEIISLSDRLEQIINQEREQLVVHTTYREAIALKVQSKEILNQARRDRAVPIVEQYQWIAAAAAFTNPVAALDLLASAAISAQMLVDLSDIYQQKFSLAQAQTASGTIGKLMVKLGVVELSTQTIASILKSHAVTYVAGGVLQGISAAYLTRLAGLSLIEYLQEQEINNSSNAQGFNLETLTLKLQQVFRQNQRAVLIQNFVKQALTRLSARSSESETIVSQA